MTQDVYYVYAKRAKNKFFMVDVLMRRADGFSEGVFRFVYVGYGSFLYFKLLSRAFL